MIPAVILAGGQASRMGGGDKTLRLLAGRPMLDWIIEALAPGHAPLAISANGPPGRFPLRALPDPILDAGPLAGVLAAMEWAAPAPAVLTVPGDTPLIPPGLGALLAPAPAVAEHAGRRHHLVALWPTSAAPALRAWLGAGRPRQVEAFAQTLGVRAVPVPAGPWGDPFANANTPEELADLERLVQRGT